MGNLSRRKGAEGERELFAILAELLGDSTIRRNLSQTRDSGADSHENIQGWTVECKRWGKNAAIMGAIEQVEVAATEANGLPVVMFRMDRGPWRALPVLSLGQFAKLCTMVDVEELKETEESGEARES